MTSVTIFDIESDGVDHWNAPSRREFFRIGGTRTDNGEPIIWEHLEDFVAKLRNSDVLIGHNTSTFDGPAVFGDGDFVRAKSRARKWIDTMWLAPLIDPAPWKYTGRDGRERVIAGKPERMLPFYKLDNLAFRYGHRGKTDDLAALAKKHGGYGAIPKDDPEYRDYLRGDLEATRHVASVLLPAMNDYAWREMRVAAIAGQMHVNGFRLDSELALSVVAAHTERNNATLERLAERYGVPLTDAKGNPRKKPLSSNEGKAALAAAFRDLMGTRTRAATLQEIAEAGRALPEGIAEPVFDNVWPMTPGGAWAWGGEVITAAAAEYGNEEVQALARDVAEIGGTRTVFKTALDNVKADGFCHPNVTMLQRTGRASITDPGLTVFGKHNGRHLERAVFLPDVLEGEAPLPDTHVLFAVDLAQMDARAVAALSQDHAYLDLFEPGRDSHIEGAQMIWGPQSGWGGVNRRQHFKKLGHGWNYGMGIPKLAREAGVSLDVAEYFDRTMKARFPRLCAWKDEVRAFAREHGWVDNGFGRRVKIDADLEHTQAPAGAGQGATRDVLLQGALDLDDIDPVVLRYLKAMVHDEFVFSVPRRYVIEIRNLVVRTLSGMWCPPGASRPVPVIADASPFADRWSACYEKAA
jgi:DNA polymerase-1